MNMHEARHERAWGKTWILSKWPLISSHVLVLEVKWRSAFYFLFGKSKNKRQITSLKGCSALFVFTYTWFGIVCVWVSTWVCLLFLCFWGHKHGWFRVWDGHDEVLVVRLLGFSLGVVHMWMCTTKIERMCTTKVVGVVWDWVLFVAHLIQPFAPSSFRHLHQRCVLCGYVRLPSWTTLPALHVARFKNQPVFCSTCLFNVLSRTRVPSTTNLWPDCRQWRAVADWVTFPSRIALSWSSIHCFKFRPVSPI